MPWTTGKRSLLAAAVLFWASCGGSSGGNNNSDALGTGGVTGGGGAAGGPPSGSAATGGSTAGGTTGGTATGGTTGGGSGGTSGGYGGNGGTPSVCSDPMFPVSCPARGDVPAICWSTGTDCSTVTKCGNDFRSCNSANTHYDCAAGSCVSNNAGDGGATADCSSLSGFPVSCPARGDVPALCWSAGTICSTIGRCNNEFKSCQAAGYHFSCADYKCVPDTASPADAGTPADASVPADASTADTAPAADAAADTHD